MDAVFKQVSCCVISYCIAGKFGGHKFGEFTRFEHLAKKSLANE